MICDCCLCVCSLEIFLTRALTEPLISKAATAHTAIGKQ